MLRLLGLGPMGAQGAQWSTYLLLRCSACHSWERREQADPWTCLGVPVREQRRTLGLPGEEPTPPPRVQGPGIRMPPWEQIGKIQRCGSPVEGDLLRIFLWAVNCYAFIYSGYHSMSAKPNRLGFMPPNYGDSAVQR